MVEKCRNAETKFCAVTGNRSVVCGGKPQGICITLNAKSIVDTLQISVHLLETFTYKYGLNFSKSKVKIMSFNGRDAVRSKIVINNNIIITKKIQSNRLDM